MATKKILVLSTDFGVEQPEIEVPTAKLKGLGHDVTVATPSGEDVQTFVGDKDRGIVFPVDAKLEDVAGEYDVLILPGGTLNSDSARIDEQIQIAVKAQAESGRTIAAVCHAPWILVETGLVEGKTLTGYESIRTDLKNAGGTVVDEEVTVCLANGWTLITSRTPEDLDAFVAAIDEA